MLSKTCLESSLFLDEVYLHEFQFLKFLGRSYDSIRAMNFFSSPSKTSISKKFANFLKYEFSIFFFLFSEALKAFWEPTPQLKCL